jgi:hypothetical protein
VKFPAKDNQKGGRNSRERRAQIRRDLPYKDSTGEPCPQNYLFCPEFVPN